MPLTTCPECGRPTPSSGMNCVHCGALAPACTACGGTGKCPDCSSGEVWGPACETCSGTHHCPTCEGRKHLWAKTGTAGPQR